MYVHVCMHIYTIHDEHPWNFRISPVIVTLLRSLYNAKNFWNLFLELYCVPQTGITGTCVESLRVGSQFDVRATQCKDVIVYGVSILAWLAVCPSNKILEQLCSGLFNIIDKNASSYEPALSVIVTDHCLFHRSHARSISHMSVPSMTYTCAVGILCYKKWWQHMHLTTSNSSYYR